MCLQNFHHHLLDNRSFTLYLFQYPFKFLSRSYAPNWTSSFSITFAVLIFGECINEKKDLKMTYVEALRTGREGYFIRFGKLLWDVNTPVHFTKYLYHWRRVLEVYQWKQIFEIDVRGKTNNGNSLVVIILQWQI